MNVELVSPDIGVPRYTDGPPLFYCKFKNVLKIKVSIDAVVIMNEDRIKILNACQQSTFSFRLG